MCQTHLFPSLHTVFLISFSEDVLIYQIIFYGLIHTLVLSMSCSPLVLLCFLSFSLCIYIRPMWISPWHLSPPFCTKSKKNLLFLNIFVTVVQVEKAHRMHLGLFSIKTSSETSIWYKIMCCISGYLRLSFFTVWMLYYFLFSPNSLPPSLFNSRQTQGALNESDDPETGCLTDNKPTSRHFYPVALLLVSSHLLVVWLILSLALLLAKYQ